MLGSTESATVARQHLGQMLGLTKSAAVVGQHISWMLGLRKSVIAWQHLVRCWESGTERISYHYALPKMMGLSEICHRPATPRLHSETNRTSLARHTLAVATVIKFTVVWQHFNLLLWLIESAVIRHRAKLPSLGNTLVCRGWSNTQSLGNTLVWYCDWSYQLSIGNTWSIVTGRICRCTATLRCSQLKTILNTGTSCIGHHYSLYQFSMLFLSLTHSYKTYWFLIFLLTVVDLEMIVVC